MLLCLGVPGSWNISPSDAVGIPASGRPWRVPKCARSSNGCFRGRRASHCQRRITGRLANASCTIEPSYIIRGLESLYVELTAN